jgi:hypothetical protein
MILGFVFQLQALREGGVTLVQPIIATELVIVFAIIALHIAATSHVPSCREAMGIWDVVGGPSPKHPSVDG